MPAVAYAMSDHAPSEDGRYSAGHISRPVSSGGCGQEHEVRVDHAGRPFIECDRCAPSLIADHYGWAARPGDVPLTCDENADQELAERDAKGHQNTLLKGMTDAFMRALKGGAGFPGMTEAPKQKSLIEQLAEMDPEERAQLAALLAPPAEAAPAKDSGTADGGVHVLKPAEPPAASGKPGGNRTPARRSTAR